MPTLARQDKPHAEAVSNSASSRAAELHNAAILTKQEAAALLRCTPRYIERMVQRGLLRALKPTGKLWRVRRTDLDAFLETGATIGEVQ